MILLAPPGVTLDFRAAPLTKAIPEIGRAFGVAMRAAPAIGDEILIASLRDADLAGFKAKIAETFAAEWTVARDGTLVFNRSVKLRTAESRRLSDARLARVHAWRAHHIESSPLATAFDAAEARRLRAEVAQELARPKPAETRSADLRRADVLSAELPGRRTYARVLAALPDEIFVGPLSPTRIVYSSAPVGVQRPLPFDPAPIMRAYTAEANAWADATADLPLSTPPPGGRIPIVLGRRGEPAAAARLLVFSVNMSYGLGGAELSLYDGEGRRIVRETGYIGDYEYMDPGERRAAVAATKFPVTLAPESKAFARIHFPEAGEGEGLPPDPAALRPFLDVLARDPLAYGASDGLFSLARARGKSLIARAGDDLAWVFRQREDGESSVTALGYFGFSLTDAGDWLVVAPADPEHDALGTIPRSRLAEMLRIADRTGLRAIEDAAALAALFPDASENYKLSKMYEGLFPLWPRFGLDNLALYGRLTPEERRRASTPDGLPLSALNPDARATLERTLYLRRELYFVPGSPADEPDRARVERGTLGEVTILLARGFPPESRLHLRDTTVDAVRFGESRWSPVLTPDEYALAEDRTANPGRYPDEYSEPLEREGLFPVVQRRLTMEVRTSRLTAEVHNFTSETRAPGGPFTATTLPARWREPNTRAVAALAEKNRNLPAAPAPKPKIPPPR